MKCLGIGCGLVLLIIGMKLEVQPVMAHPLDRVYLDVDINQQNISAKLTVSWQELSYMAEKYGGLPFEDSSQQNSGKVNAFDQQMQRVLNQPSRFQNYLKPHIWFKNGGNNCIWKWLPLGNYNREQTLIGRGVAMPMAVTCPTVLSQFTVGTDIMMQDFPYQIVEVKISNGQPVILSKDLREMNLDLTQPLITKITPTLAPLPTTYEPNTWWNRTLKPAILRIVQYFTKMRGE
jgi:hypothetical protein